MLNSKLEKVIVVITWYIIAISLRFILPLSYPLTNFKDKLGIIVATTIITSLLFSLYLKLRNKKVNKNVDLHISKNEYDLCVPYIEKCLKGHKSSIWLRLKKAYVLAMCGRIGEFNEFVSALKSDKKIIRNPQFEYIQKYEIIFDYLTLKDTNQPTQINTYDNTQLSQISNILQNSENMTANDIIPIALKLHNTSYSLYKSIVSLILAEQYAKIYDFDNSHTYAIKAKEFAPSPEVSFYLNKHDIILTNNED